MLWHAYPHVHRLTLRVNEDRANVRLWSFVHQRWLTDNEIGPQHYSASATATLHIDHHDTVRLSSARGYPQRVYLANYANNTVIGRINIGSSGAISMHAEAAWAVDNTPGWNFHQTTTAIIGLAPGFTLNITDVIDEDVDLIRHRRRNNTLFIPNRYLNGTNAYDAQVIGPVYPLAIAPAPPAAAWPPAAALPPAAVDPQPLVEAIEALNNELVNLPMEALQMNDDGQIIMPEPAEQAEMEAVIEQEAEPIHAMAPEDGTESTTSSSEPSIQDFASAVNEWDSDQ